MSAWSLNFFPKWNPVKVDRTWSLYEENHKCVPLSECQIIFLFRRRQTLLLIPHNNLCHMPVTDGLALLCSNFLHSRTVERSDAVSRLHREHCLLFISLWWKTTLQKHKANAIPESETDCGFFQTHKRKAQKGSSNSSWSWERTKITKITLISVVFFIIKLGSPNTIFNMPAHCTVLPSIIEG